MPPAAWSAGVASSAVGAIGRRERLALATAAASAIGMVAVGVLALAFETGRRRDAVMLEAFTGLDRSSIHPAIKVIALSVNPVPYACAGLALVGACLVRRRVWRAAAVATVLLGSGAAAQVLKHLLDRPRFPTFAAGARVEDIGWPSGHAAAATALAMCAVLVAPPAWRAAVALAAGAYAVVLAHATLALTWHYPSEVLGGILLAGVWGVAALAALAPLEAVGEEPRTQRPAWWLIAGSAAAACVAAAMVAVASAVVPVGGGDRAAVATCAFTIAALTFALLVATVVTAPPGIATDEGDALTDAPAVYGASDRRAPGRVAPVPTRR
jgi:membrane-associated phospholipid phosphatase